MKKIVLSLMVAFATATGFSQEVEYTEYDLDNGLHVILHQENGAPVVTTAVMYQVGAKDEEPGRTGFAHFFEHLLFEGTENIERGKWFDIVSANGGSNNANTTQDRTYYYETFPSNNLEMGLWMESERMLHPKIEQVGVDTQNEVVKEEKRQRIDNAPYGAIIYRTGIDKHLFKKHPYGQSVIGSMEDLNAAKLDEFQAFNDKYYNPNNATLVVAGDIDIKETKKMIEDYFGPIPNKAPRNERKVIKEDPITETRYATEYDANIQIPVKIFSYITPKSIDRDAYVIDYISAVLTGGASSRMQVRMVDEEQIALQVLAFGQSNQDYGTYTMGALAKGDVALSKLAEVMDEEIVKLQTELISEREYQKLQNNFEAQYVSSNSRVEGIAASLARYNMLMGDTSLINKELDIYRSITREDIKRVANQYLKPNQRLELDYLAGTAPTEEEMKDAMEEVKVVDNKLQINKIYFDNDKAVITESASKELDRIANMMIKNVSMEILAETYTDTRGSDAYNKTLSQKRADAVRSYIIAKGIDANRIKAVGRGEDNPVVDCESKECSDEEYEQSRRTEFTITKK
ncbi:putative Zn-dependent peptidase [Nonlabens dokdonensis]|jgi:predicted Zn-dependent peptidase|uniref:Insulin-like peptidase, M16 family n=2 Tax=Nonlabens dokdonensis TaxID=328515 RepID=L7WA65_NONDD|nr:insulinase family protein [Nonlabens dokdonensis]AGC76736.1 insulin-like peptidase, M16 family [Nonlabens dokdonensis DSW-6]PZX44383.1 putative Zn-dependent peptidase [Nonlabens dokdonensis]